MALIDTNDCPCDGCQAKPCGHPAHCLKFAGWLNKTVEAVPVVHARWEYVGLSVMKRIYRCTNCTTLVYGQGDYCRACGAKMDAEEPHGTA